MSVSSNAEEYKSVIGLRDLYITEVTADSAAAYTTDTPEYFAPAAEANIEPSTSRAVQYADDQPYAIMTGEGETVIKLKVTGIPLEMLAKILGKEFDAVNGVMYDNNGQSPDMALAFRSKKSNGNYRYYWFFKGRFDMPKENAITEGESPEPQVTEITYTAIPTIHTWTMPSGGTDSSKGTRGDEDTTNFSATGWFTAVRTPDWSAPASLALSSSDPTDGAAAVVVTKTITLTFNNALPAGAINHVIVAKADGTLVACTNSLDATSKIMTVNPDASLDAASVYIVSIGVTDIYGDGLIAAINFTTA